MARQYDTRVQFVGIGSQDSLSALEAFVAKHGLALFPNASDPDGALRADLGVAGQPSWIFIDAAGKADKVFGELGAKKLQGRLDALLQA